MDRDKLELSILQGTKTDILPIIEFKKINGLYHSITGIFDQMQFDELIKQAKQKDTLNIIEVRNYG